MSDWYKNVEVAETRADLFDVCRLRYHVYVDELKRDNYSYIDSVQQTLEDPLDHANGVMNLMVKAPKDNNTNGFLAGCARIHVPVPEKYNEMFGILDTDLYPNSTPNHFAFFSRFMVKAEFRGRNGTTDSLYEESYTQARKMGAKYLMLNCTPSLATAYERKGWVRYKNMYWDEDMGLQMPMCLPMEDIPFLSTFGSFSILPGSLVNPPPVASTNSSPDYIPKGEWLTSILRQLEPPMVSSKFCSPPSVQNFFLQRISMDQMDQVGLFKNTTSEERMKLLISSGGCIPFIKVKAGDGISRLGDVRDEAYLVLSGRVQVQYKGIVLGYGGIGSLIGEKAFLSGAKRAVAVKVVEDAELMVLSRILLLKVMKKIPELAVKLLFNIACTVSAAYSDNMEKMQAEIEALQEKTAHGHQVLNTAMVGGGPGRVIRRQSTLHDVMRDSCSSEIKEYVFEANGDTVEVMENTVEETEKVKGKKKGLVSKVISLAASAEAEGASLLNRIRLKWDKKASLSNQLR